MREPLWIIGPLWPFALLMPYLPGLPRPAMGGLPWRQEIIVALLLSATFALLVKRARASTEFSLEADRTALSLLLPGCAFVLWNAASVFWAAHPYSAAHGAFQWSAYLLFFVLIRRVAARPRILRASMVALGALLWLLCISSTIQFLAGTNGSGAIWQQQYSRFSGFGEPMAVAIPIFAALALSVRRSRWALLCGATALIGWLGILQSLERAPIIGALAGLLLIAAGAVAVRRCRPRSLRRALTLMAVFIFATTMQLTLLSTNAGNPSALARFQSGSSAETTSTRVRLLYWGIGLEMWRMHPLIGVGANNFQVAYPEARARFSAQRLDDPFIDLNQEKLAQLAHNEYVQILAELGIIGLLLFASFTTGMIVVFWRVLRRHPRPLVALGAGGGMFAFALSSGASSFSFRWTASGLLFFFAAALLTRFASEIERRDEKAIKASDAFTRPVLQGALVLSLIIFCGAGAQALNSISHGAAGASADRDRAERLYQAALRWNPYDAAAHCSYGLWLYHAGRAREAVPHLRYAAANGFNTSGAYAYLAAAEATSDDPHASERTLALAARVYPRSVFIRVRYAAALAATGRKEESEREYAAALSIDPRMARGWWHLINHGVDAAAAAAQEDSSIILPGQLFPEDGVFAVMVESKLRARREQEKSALTITR